MSGEAYFEVAKVMLEEKGLKNKSLKMPFQVATNHQTVQVLGTHFNINSYKDENSTKTTLLEGAVAVSPAIGSSAPVRLKPGQQSDLVVGMINVSDANIEESIAWKNGYFSFNDKDIQVIMRELSRWYGVEVK